MASAVARRSYKGGRVVCVCPGARPPGRGRADVDVDAGAEQSSLSRGRARSSWASYRDGSSGAAGRRCMGLLRFDWPMRWPLRGPQLASRRWKETSQPGGPAGRQSSPPASQPASARARTGKGSVGSRSAGQATESQRSIAVGRTGRLHDWNSNRRPGTARARQIRRPVRVAGSSGAGRDRDFNSEQRLPSRSISVCLSRPAVCCACTPSDSDPSSLTWRPSLSNHVGQLQLQEPGGIFHACMRRLEDGATNERAECPNLPIEPPGG